MENNTNQKGDQISREGIKKVIVEKLEKWGDGYPYIEIPTDDAIREMTLAINEAEAEAVDAYEQGYTDGWKERFGEPDGRPKGEWVITKLQHGEDVTCPFCNARPRRSEYGYYLHDNYCPECGADLRKVKSSGGI